MDRPSIITKLVQEEIGNMVNEINYSNNGKFDFIERFTMANTQPNRYFDFFNYEMFTTEYDMDVIDYDITVNWSVSFQLNDSGIENFIINAENLQGIFTVEMRNKQSDEIEGADNKRIEEFQWKYIMDDANITKGGSLYIHHLMFDFKQKTCTFVFTN